MGLIEFLLIARSAIISAGIVVSLICLFYFIYIFYHQKKGNKINIQIRRLILLLVFIGYVVVVIFATLMNRSGSSSAMQVNFQLFSFYRKAINSVDIYDWNIIFLNILMFIPLGILLPVCFKKFRSWWKVYLTGFVCTCMIEGIQLITYRGLFELDDIFNNTLGCMLGFGAWILGYSIYQKIRTNKKINKKIFIYQLPLLLTVVSFLAMYISYSLQELGNLRQASYETVDMSHIEVSSLISLPHQVEKQYVYKVIDYSQQQCYKQAKSVFDKQGLEIDNSLTKSQDDWICFYSKNKELAVVINCYGGAMTINFQHHDVKKAGLSLEKIKTILNNAGILPYQVEAFKDLGDGQYELKVDYINNGIYYEGIINCYVDINGQLISFNSKVKAYKEYKLFSIITPYQAYQLIKKGKFNTSWLNGFDTKMVIQSVELEYVEDSKGFYQPIYLFGLDDGGLIVIPAVR